jgi:hypothetical protein
MTTQKRYKIPVILYESEEQAIPYVEIQEGDEMPPTIFLQEYKHTGEFEPDSNGSEQPIVDMTMHMFVDMDVLSKKLSPSLYDEVRTSIGLQPVKKAREEGQKILDRVYQNVNQQTETALEQKEQTKEELSRRLNEKLSEKFFKHDNVELSEPADN